MLTRLRVAAASSEGEAVGRGLVLLAVGAAQVALLAGLAYVGMPDFGDEFDAFDAERWSRGDHQLGRSYLDPANVGVGAGNLRIKLPARSLEGGEIRSNALYGYGAYSAP
jgi:hypothetical protein